MNVPMSAGRQGNAKAIVCNTCGREWAVHIEEVDSVEFCTFCDAGVDQLGVRNVSVEMEVK